MIIDHVAENPRWRNHATPAMYGFQSYISMPIVLHDGTFFGTLCAIDPQAGAAGEPGNGRHVRMFADLIAFHLQADARLATSEASLASGERKASEFREQFIAVLGHDLRNPLASISAGTRLLLKGRPEREVGRDPEDDASRASSG